MTATVNRSCYCSDDCWQATCPYCPYRTRHNFTAEDAVADVARHTARNHPEGHNMTIVVEYYVTCDAPHPNDIDFPSEMCEAEFSHTGTGFADITGLWRQMQGRGWNYRDGKFRCPRHNPKGTT